MGGVKLKSAVRPLILMAADFLGAGKAVSSEKTDIHSL